MTSDNVHVVPYVRVRMASSRGGGHAKVRVVARSRPTANFPHDIIGVEEDGKV